MDVWACDRCTLLNEGGLSCRACGSEASFECHVEQIWNVGSLKALLLLVGNVLEHPGEAKYLGPIKKSNARINGSIVQVAGAARVLRAAGFSEDAESFFLVEPSVPRLRRVQLQLQKQLEQVEQVQTSLAYRPAVSSTKPKFDENLLREIQAEAQHQATLRGVEPAAAVTVVPTDVPTTAAVLRLRLRIPLGGSLEMRMKSETTVLDFQEEVRRLTGVQQQRLRFGFPKSRVLEPGGTLQEAGLQDGELLILEDLHDLFLGSLESGQFTMEEMLDKVPPSEDHTDCTATLFLDVLSSFAIETHEMDFWHAVRDRLRKALDKGREVELRAGLQKLQQLFRHHDTRQRMQLILASLPRGKGSNKLVIQRSCFLQSVVDQVLSMSRKTMLTRLNVTYYGEKGVDAGGLTRDFFSSFAKHMAEESWLWRSTGRGSLHPTHVAAVRSAKAKQVYQACGRVFAMALLHGCKLGRPLSRAFVRQLLNLKADSLSELQAELHHEEGDDYRCGQDILEKPLEELSLTGVLSFSHDGEDFLPGGSQIEVTDANKEQWLWHSLHHELVGDGRAADAFRQGLIDVLGGKEETCPLLFLFAAEDLMDLWGTGAIGQRELQMWKQVSSHSSRLQQQAQWFWQVLEEDFDDELRSKVLQFATGSASIGRDGLQHFRLEPGDGSDGRLPSAMTCGNLLQLPRYSSREVLRRQLRTAVESTGSFEML